MPFKNRADRLKYINAYNKSYYKANRTAILAQKAVYHQRNKESIHKKQAAGRKGKEVAAALNTRQWYAANSEKAKLTAFKIRLRTAYGIDPAVYASMRAKQRGRCAICRAEPRQRLCVDHCHKTGRVRGLLCRNCNAGLGLLKDSPKLLIKALRYLGVEQRALLNALKEKYT